MRSLKIHDELIFLMWLISSYFKFISVKYRIRNCGFFTIIAKHVSQRYKPEIASSEDFILLINIEKEILLIVVKFIGIMMSKSWI